MNLTSLSDIYRWTTGNYKEIKDFHVHKNKGKE